MPKIKEKLSMDKYIKDEQTGLKYELIGDHYFLA
jgi:hypothetical protein